MTQIKGLKIFVDKYGLLKFQILDVGFRMCILLFKIQFCKKRYIPEIKNPQSAIV